MPKYVYTAVDMENRVDGTYVEHFGETLQDAGYKIFVYGSASSVFGNPLLNGYWVARTCRRPYMNGPFPA